MQFIKEEDKKTRNYIFQKDTKTITITTLVAIILVILIFGVVVSGLYLEWF